MPTITTLRHPSTLPETDRALYERLCDEVESNLQKGQSLSEVASQIQAPSHLRELVLLDLVRCWLEVQAPANVRTQDVIAVLPELSGSREAIAAAISERPFNPFGIIADTHELVKELPHNGLSRVYLVRHRSLGRLEVLKAVRLQDGIHEALADRIKDEAVRATRIRHSGLVEVFDAGSSDGWSYLLMEHMNGGSLADRLRTGTLPWEIAVRQFAVVARALEALHSKGNMAHGDIKPGNLMYTRSAEDQERIKIGDFGLSSDLHSDDHPEGRRVVLGTPGFLAPELLTRSPNELSSLPFDERVTADVFSLGVTFYQSITGRLPYQVKDEIDPRGALVNPLVPAESLVPGLPSVLAYVIRRGCSVDRAERFASAAEFACALESCVPTTTANTISSSSVGGGRINPPQSPTPARSRFPTTLALAVGGALVSIVAGFWNFPHANDERISSSKKTGNGQNQTKAPISTPTLPVRPADDSEDLRELRDKRKWPEDAAKSVLDNYRPWLEALRSSPKTTKLADEQFNRLASLVIRKPDFSLLKSQPHFAGVLTLATETQCQKELEILLKEAIRNDNDWNVTNLLVQYPFTTTAEACVYGWGKHKQSLTIMFHQGVFGAEEILLFGKNGEPYLDWVHDLLVNRVDRSPKDAPHLLAVLFEHHHAVASRVRANPEFGRRLVEELWPQFQKLTIGTDAPSKRLALRVGLWDALMLPEGYDLIRRYHDLPIDMFTGTGAFPEDQELRQAALSYLRDGYAPIVTAFASKDWRQSADFQALIRRGLDKKLFAVICLRVTETTKAKADRMVGDLKGQTNRQLQADITGVDLDRWGAEAIIPQIIYIRLGTKLISGETVYSVEWRNGLKQVAADIVTYVIPVAPIDPSYLNSIQSGFRAGLESGDRAVQDLLSQEQLRALAAPRQPGATAEDVLQLSQELRAIFSKITERLNARQPEPVLDISSTRALFSGLLHDSDFERIDMRRVRLMRLADGRLFGLPAAEWFSALDNRAVRDFFEDRFKVLQRRRLNNAQDAEFEKAYRELLGAWWLLGSSGALPSFH